MAGAVEKLWAGSVEEPKGAGRRERAPEETPGSRARCYAATVFWNGSIW